MCVSERRYASFPIFDIDWARVMQCSWRMSTYRAYDLTEVADAGHRLTGRPDMALREFTDWLGRDWLVWEVEPFLVERHVILEHRSDANAERRGVGHRRTRTTSELSDGWLVFESAFERRRLYPYPEEWATLSEADLGALLEQASPTQHARRLLD
jgi:hypothetical protein